MSARILSIIASLLLSSGLLVACADQQSKPLSERIRIDPADIPKPKPKQVQQVPSPHQTASAKDTAPPRMEVRSEAEEIEWREARRRDVHCRHSPRFDGEATGDGAPLAEAMRRGDKVAARRAISGGAATFPSLPPAQKRWIDRTRLSGRLNDAVLLGDPGNVKLLLAQGADPNIAFEDDSALSAVAIAARCNRPKALRLLIAAGGEVDRRVLWTDNYRYQNESRPLSLAVDSNALEAVEVLLAAGADPNGLDYNEGFNGYVTAGPPLLQLPSRAIARALLRAGADPNYADPETGLTPLISAAESNAPGLVRLLLQYGANPDIRLRDGRTAAQVARDKGALEALAVLRKPPARLRPDRVVWSAARRRPPGPPAVTGGRGPSSDKKTIVSGLPGEEAIEANVSPYSEAATTTWLGRWWEDVLCRDPDWSEPVTWDRDSDLLAEALRGGDLNLARIEVAGRAATPPGLKPDQQKWLTRTRQSARLVRASARGDLVQVRALIAQGADPALNVEDGSTIGALAQAAQCNHPKVVRVLIESGVKVDQRFRWLWEGMEIRDSTALTLAARSGALSSVKVLLAAGANPDIREITLEIGGGSDRKSPLILARTHAITEALLKAGADPDLGSLADGDTPLMKAARNNDPGRVAMLLKYGANPEIRDKQGLTAADWAKRMGAPEAYAALWTSARKGSGD
jgi:ankyrin repeat protein